MNKNFPLLLLVFSILICGINSGTVYAISNDKPRPLEKIYPEIGYKTVEEAVKEFEHHFKQDLKLPLRVSPVSFTHIFGRFDDVEGNDSFEMEYISEQSSENHFMINVRPVKDKLKIMDREVVKVYKLLNGKDATFISISDANLLVFERDNLQYRFSVDKRISDKVTPEMLVGIAN